MTQFQDRLLDVTETVGKAWRRVWHLFENTIQRSTDTCIGEREVPKLCELPGDATLLPTPAIGRLGPAAPDRLRVEALILCWIAWQVDSSGPHEGRSGQRVQDEVSSFARFR